MNKDKLSKMQDQVRIGGKVSCLFYFLLFKLSSTTSDFCCYSILCLHSAVMLSIARW